VSAAKWTSAGRAWAYGGATLGGLVSVAANVAHSYVPPVAADADWSPQPGAVIGAVFWPVALLVAVEILARVAWPADRLWLALRWAGVGPVALVAAVVSYRHLSGLLAFYREDAMTARLGPLAVDGLMLVATGALIATSANRPVLDEAIDEAPAEGPSPRAARIEAPEPSRGPVADTAAAVARLRARRPDMTTGQIAARLGVTDRTVRRHLAARTSGDPPAPGAAGPARNGTEHVVARGAAAGLGTSPRPGFLTTTRAAEEHPS
jgi:hypothetical protein